MDEHTIEQLLNKKQRMQLHEAIANFIHKVDIIMPIGCTDLIPGYNELTELNQVLRSKTFNQIDHTAGDDME